MKKAYLVHGWMGNPNNCWFPCLKEKLEELNFEVIIPQMPNPGEPKIETWVPHLQEIAKDADEESIFIGHSIGCQTILRFLEKINTKIKASFLVAPFFNLDLEDAPKEDKEIAKPWLETPIDLEKVKTNCDKIIALFSTDDEYVPVTDAKLFEERLNTKSIVLENRAHFEIYKELPELFEEIQQLYK